MRMHFIDPRNVGLSFFTSLFNKVNGFHPNGTQYCAYLYTLLFIKHNKTQNEVVPYYIVFRRIIV